MKILKIATPCLIAIGIFGFASCSNHDVENNPSTQSETAAKKYKSNFEAKYGKVNSKQTWDFSGNPTIKDDVEVLTCEQPTVNETTRAISSAAVIKNDWSFTSPADLYIANLEGVNTINDLAYIRAYAAGLEEKDWTEDQIYGINDMWVWYVHGFAGQETALADQGGYAMYSLGIHAIEIGTGSYGHGTEYFTSLPITGGAAANNWYYGTGNYYFAPYVDTYPHAGYTLGHRINASALKDTEKYSDVYWWAMVDDGTPQTTSNGDKEFREKWELKKYKEYITPTGAVYWLFDCNHDGDYTDLVCLVEPVEASKRYMVEDLGTTDDFDFNDLVIDVRAQGDRQWAIVRAMGGTLDFTVKIGNTTWSKSESGMNITTMYNTQRGAVDYDAVLAEFDVTGWNPLTNNITVTVKGKDSSAPVVIPFPKKGEIPMIIAEHPARKWMYERESIPAEWFTEE